MSEEDTETKALAYLKGEMAGGERSAFEAELARSEAARAALERARTVLERVGAASDESAARTLNALIARAIEQGASDLHLRPERRDVAVQVRVDGALREMERLSKERHAPVLDRLKVMADMDVSERRVPQDGRIPLQHGATGKDYDLRVTTIPSLYGESAVVRILSRSAEDARLGLDNLGLGAEQVAGLRRLVRRPAGLVVVTGNAGQGKTTLLYSLLQAMQAPDLPRRSLFTVEDPVEYQLPGVVQTGVNPRAGLTYEAALHTLLRADADAVLCAQMRSQRVAELLVELAHTGRLVLTALHVSSAPSVVDWLLGAGLDRFLVAEALAGAVGLRLVGRVCESCREEYHPPAEEVRRAGLSPVEDGPFFRGRGCDACGGTGVRGRVPLCEVLEVGGDAALRRRTAAGAAGDDLWADAFGAAGGSLRDDARARVRAGQLSVEAANWALMDYPHGAAASAPHDAPTLGEGYYQLPPPGGKEGV